MNERSYPVKHPPYTLRLPRRKALELFKRQAAFYAVIKADSDRREKVAVDWLSRNASERLVRHRIRPEENLSVLAKRYNVRVSDLKRWNHLRGSMIRSGRILTIYARDHKARKTRDGYVYHTIRRGETLSQIAVHQIRIQTLHAWNDIQGSRIRAGKKIRVR